MNSPSACDACGKKFKVFVIKKKCKHCSDVVCKACLAVHLELKHTRVKRSPRDLRQRASFEMFDLIDDNERERPQSLSAMDAVDSELEDANPDGVKDEDASGAKREEDGDVDDVEESKTVRMTTLSRQSLTEEKKTCYRELQLIQEAVAEWTIKEMRIKQEMRRVEEGGYRVAIALAFSKMCGGEEPCLAVTVGYAVAATVGIWTLFGLLFSGFV
uniref:FYVE zinc finger domain-containing protein n=1 Tax=Peronospora matthiolae TaxID=2874970 RepID=A0AAV1TVB8_9STRA